MHVLRRSRPHSSRYCPPPPPPPPPPIRPFQIIELLKKAIKAKKAPGLLSAINKANELGLSADGGPGAKEMADAKEALMALGAQSEALLRLEEAVNASDLERIDAGIKECEKMGLGEEEQITAARDAKKRIAKQNKAATALKKAVEGRSREEVKAALVVGEELNLAKRFEDIVESATKLLELMDKEDALVKQMTSCAEQVREGERECVCIRVQALVWCQGGRGMTRRGERGYRLLSLFCATMRGIVFVCAPCKCFTIIFVASTPRHLPIRYALGPLPLRRTTRTASTMPSTRPSRSAARSTCTRSAPSARRRWTDARSSTASSRACWRTRIATRTRSSP